jgi:hypothetical protein
MPSTAASAFGPYSTHRAYGLHFTRCLQAVLPHSLGSNLRVLVFARGAAADAARAGSTALPRTATRLTAKMQRERITWALKTS